MFYSFYTLNERLEFQMYSGERNSVIERRGNIYFISE